MFLIIRLSLMFFSIAAIIGALLWARKNRQFEDMDRASRLPLDIGLKEEEDKKHVQV